MTLTQHFLDELEREAVRTRRTLQEVPAGQDDWAPHPKSMPLGRLAGLVATMPSWIPMIVEQDSLDINPPGGSGQFRQPQISELVSLLDTHAAAARETLKKTSDEHLLTTSWKLLAGGNVMMEQPRHIVLRDTFNHLAHHRGQLTVYLRLTGAKVPAIYGPSADDQQFA